ncbi:hypothetical protein [Clostridium sp. LP20]|uniref:hypothetical protein n=1 Tax=Clostridium sp. LP20 TaxID=3418665 RepID=UPI003EE611E2
MKERLIRKLTSARFLMSIILTAVLSYMAIRGTITGEQFVPLVTMVIAFYFTKDKAQLEEGEKKDLRE